MSNEYFFLNRESLFHKGQSNFAVYNIFNGDIISINQLIGSILVLTEDGKNINEIAQLLGMTVAEVCLPLNDLVKQELGNYYSSRIYIEKYKVGSPIEMNLTNLPIIKRCFVELPGECELDCAFCGQPTLFQCSTCTRLKTNADVFSTKAFISRILQMNCEQLIIHGGDPLSNLDQLKSVVQYSREQGYKRKILLITNGSLIDYEIAKWFVKYQVHPIVPVFHSIKNKQASYLKSIFDLTREMKIPLVVTNVIIEGENAEESSIKDVLLQIKPDSLMSSVIFAKDRIDRPPTMRRINADIYYNSNKHHPCLWGTLAISASGDILPCPHLRKEVLGHIEDPNCIESIFERKIIDDYWNLPLSLLDNCRDCAFQFGCLDCRAVEMRFTGDLYGKSLCKFRKIN
jgi:radical SAM protein with 4Fe4S-binding SPASM domain